MPYRILSAIAFLLLLTVTTALAAEQLTFVMESYEPYEYTEAGAFKGIDVETLRRVCERAGCEAHFVDVPWNRAMDMVQKGNADAIFSLFKTPEREEFLVFPGQHLSMEKNVIITAKGSGLIIKTIEDLKGKNVGVVTNYAYDDAFDASKLFTRDESSNNDTMLKKQAGKRTDAGVINQLVLETVAPGLGLKDAFDIQPYVVSEGKLFIGFSKAKGEHAAKWAKIFDEQLKALRAEGAIK